MHVQVEWLEASCYLSSKFSISFLRKMYYVLLLSIIKVMFESIEFL
jgi:hypothetical protein